MRDTPGGVVQERKRSDVQGSRDDTSKKTATFSGRGVRERKVAARKEEKQAKNKTKESCVNTGDVAQCVVKGAR